MSRTDGRVTADQRAVLTKLAGARGIIWLHGDDAATAIGMAATKLIALGPDEPDGAIPASITPEGRALIAQEATDA